LRTVTISSLVTLPLLSTDFTLLTPQNYRIGYVIKDKYRYRMTIEKFKSLEPDEQRKEILKNSIIRKIRTIFILHFGLMLTIRPNPKNKIFIDINLKLQDKLK